MIAEWEGCPYCRRDEDWCSCDDEPRDAFDMMTDRDREDEDRASLADLRHEERSFDRYDD